MNTPGRSELRQIYEDLADEVLMEIALNDNGEYESTASEVARTVLDGRGVNIPSAECEEVHGGLDACEPGACGVALPQDAAGENLTGPVAEIPRFKAEETAEVEAMLSRNNIQYERYAVMVQSCSSCGCNEYVYRVPEASFPLAVRLIKNHYVSQAESASSGSFSGNCPACGTESRDVRECSDCGLVLVVDYRESLENHQFFKFLKKNNL